MLKKYIRKLLIAYGIFKEVKKKKNDWNEAIANHTCYGNRDMVGCDACRYTSLKIGGFSDDCIKLLMSNTIPMLPQYKSELSPVVLADGLSKAGYHV